MSGILGRVVLGVLVNVPIRQRRPPWRPRQHPALSAACSQVPPSTSPLVNGIILCVDVAVLPMPEAPILGCITQLGKLWLLERAEENANMPE